MSNILSVVYYFLNCIATALSDASSSPLIQLNDEKLYENYSIKENNRNLKNKKLRKNDFYKKRNEFDEKFTIEVYDDNDDDDDNINDLMDFDDKEFIESIMKREKENNNLYENENENSTETELTDFEKEILDKYMKEYQEKENNVNNNNIEMVIENNINNNNNNIITNDDNNNNNNNIENDTILLQSASTSSFSSAGTSDVRINSLSHQLSNNNNNNNNLNRDNSNSHRNRDIRRNLSVWVGVTSCVWGLLLYFVKSYM